MSRPDPGLGAIPGDAVGPGRGGIGTAGVGLLPRGGGVRWFAGAGLVNALGTGFFYPYQLLFFTNFRQLPLLVAGAGLTVAILVALPFLPYLGRLVDRLGARPVLIASALLRGVAFVGYLQLDGVVAFVALSVLVALGARAEQVATPVLAAAAAPKGQTAAWLALTRVVFNAGIGAGGLLAALVLVRAPAGYALIGWLNAASFVLAALLYLPMAAGRPDGRTVVGRVRPWRNPLFRRLAVTRFLLSLVLVGVETAVPVYLVRHLRWPTWTVGAMFATFTALVMVLQLPISHRLRRHRTMPVVAVGALLHGGLLLALSLSAGLGRPTQLVVMTAGALLYTAGGIISAQALMVALVAVPPPAECGAYQAFSQLLVGLSLAVTPLLVTVFLEHWPAGLWWLLLAVVGYIAVDMLTHTRRFAAELAEATSQSA